MFKSSEIPMWVNIFMLLILFFMGIQVYWYYFDHQFLLDAGITIETVADQNVIYTTAGRLVAMIGATLFVMFTQNAKQYLVVLLLSILREGQETIIDPLLPLANGPDPIIDFWVHIVIVALEIAAFVAVYKRSKTAS